MKKLFLLAPILAFVILAAASCTPSSPVAQTPEPIAENATPTPTPKPTTSAGTVKTAAKTVMVRFSDSGFSPATISVNVGDAVKIVNDSSAVFWPASDPHPIHTGNTALNAKGTVAVGDSFISEVLTRAGSFGVHNHLNPTQKMVVEVK